MENAITALKFAGGVLVTAIVIAIFYLIYGEVTESAILKKDDSAQKELIAFNNAFSAYNKDLMYGSDVISVLNKAIDNNRQYGLDTYDETNDNIDYYVDIEVIYRAKNGDVIWDDTLSDNKGDIHDILGKVKEPLSKRDDDTKNFMLMGFRCTGVENVSATDLNFQSAQSAIGRIKKMTFETWQR